MSNALLQAGAIPKGGQSAWAPIFSNEFFSGLYTNRNPLRDPATPFLYQKFYSATRYEAMWDGLNIEISPRLTMIRAPGHSVYNSGTFPAINDFYSYHVKIINGSPQDTIRVVADTVTGVYDITGPSTNSLIYSKATNAGQCRFLAVGNTLYMGDGINNWQYLSPSFIWQSGYSMPSGAFIVDSHGNCQLALGQCTACSEIVISNGVLTATVSSTSGITTGSMVTFYGMTSSFLNGLSLVVATVGTNTFTANCTASNLTESESGYVVIPSANGTLGTTQPSFSTGWLGLTHDGSNLWMQSGPRLRVWGLPAPTYAPTPYNALNSSLIEDWEASTYYLPSPAIIVVAGNIYQLTTSGETGSSAPSSWNTGVNSTTSDGTGVWTCLGTASRQTSHGYTVGAIIEVTWETAIPAGGVSLPTQYSCFFICTSAGNSSSTASGLLPWGAGFGSQTVDGTVTWKNIGYAVTRSAASSSSPLFEVVSSVNTLQAGNIGNSTGVSNLGQVIDTNGAVETCTLAGLSSSAAITWSTTTGASTTDNGIIWLNAGNSPAVGGTASGAGAWVYTYAYMDIITGSVGPAASLSIPIVLGPDSYIELQGIATTLSSVGLINIYRSTQGEATPFLIGQIQNSGQSQIFTYNDFSPDQGQPGSTMNNAIEADLTGVNSAPPTGFVPVALHLSAIWGFVDNILYRSYGGDVVDMMGGWEAFPPVNYIAFQSAGQVGWSTNYGLYVILTDSIQLIAGTSAPFSPSQIAAIGILSPNCFSLNGQCPFLYTADRQVVSIDPSAGVAVDGFAIANLLAVSPFSPTTAYLTWYVNGTDQRLFCSDGSTGYYNMLSSIPPEPSSAVWSPKRVIAGGCSAVKAIETSPGTYQLLVGPASSGNILYRDITSAEDNGSTYPAWAIVGSNVLCHAGQIAEIGFIHVEAVRVGAVPQVAILLNEVAGWPGAPPFQTLPKYEHDPPRLAESGSIYSNRHYVNQTRKPAWCRHLMLRFTFAQENQLNELLSFTIFGCLRVERTEAGR